MCHSCACATDVCVPQMCVCHRCAHTVAVCTRARRTFTPQVCVRGCPMRVHPCCSCVPWVLSVCAWHRCVPVDGEDEPCVLLPCVCEPQLHDRVRWWCVWMVQVYGCACWRCACAVGLCLEDQGVCIPMHAVCGNVSLKVMYICKPTLLCISDNNKSPTRGSHPMSQRIRMGQKPFLPLPCLSAGLSPSPLFGFLLFVTVSLSRHPAARLCLFWEDKV